MDPLCCVPYCTKFHWEPQNIDGPSIWCPQGLFSLQCICITLINVNRSYICIVRGEQTLCLIWMCTWRWFSSSLGIQNDVNKLLQISRWGTNKINGVLCTFQTVSPKYMEHPMFTNSKAPQEREGTFLNTGHQSQTCLYFIFPII